MKGQNVWLPVTPFSQAIGASVTADEVKIVMRYPNSGEFGYKEIRLDRDSSDVYIEDGTIFINLEKFSNLLKVQYSVDLDQNEILLTSKLD